MSKYYKKLCEEGLLASEPLQNKITAKILRSRETEVVIECNNCTRFLCLKQKLV